MAVSDLTEHIWDENFPISIRLNDNNMELHKSTCRFYERAYDECEVADWGIDNFGLTVWVKEV